MPLVRHRYAISVTDHTKLWYKVRYRIAKSSAQVINSVEYSMYGIVQNGGPSSLGSKDTLMEAHSYESSRASIMETSARWNLRGAFRYRRAL
jgi:hypothetical protein